MRTNRSGTFAAGSVSTGFIHATPGEMKSLRSSADSIALIVEALLGAESAKRCRAYAGCCAAIYLSRM